MTVKIKKKTLRFYLGISVVTNANIMLKFTTAFWAVANI